MAKKKTTPKKTAAKKRAANRIPPPPLDMTDYVGCCKPYEPSDLEKGRNEAYKAMQEQLDKEPWHLHEKHKQNVSDINERLDYLEAEKKRLLVRLVDETAKRDGYRVMILAAAGVEFH
jgi:flagellar motility protein MotE (MotC chaperone)